MNRTIKEIKELIPYYETYYSELHNQQKVQDDFYELVFKAGIPTKIGYKQLTPSTARDWVDVGVRHFTLDNPNIKVPQRHDSETAKAKDAALEAFYNFWARRVILTIKSGCKKLLLRGECFLRVGMDDTYFGKDISGLTDKEREEFEQKRLYHFPLWIKVPDPINVFPSPAHDGLVPIDVVECYSITVAEARNLCKHNNWKWDTDKKSTTLVTWASYIDAEVRAFFLGDSSTKLTPLLTPEVQDNILGFCPYVHIPSGFGNENYEGKPEYLYRGILYSKRDMLKAQCRILSQSDAINTRYAWNRIKLIGEDKEVEKLYPDKKVSLDPDVPIREIEGRVKVEILQGESPPPGIFQQLAVVSSMAEPPPVLGGVRPSGIYSAQGIEDLMATAKPIYKDALKNYEDGLAIAFGMGAKIIDTVYKHPVAIKDLSSDDKKQQKKIKPEDIDGHYDCEVQLLAEPPEATDMRKTLGMNLWRSGLISLKTTLTQYFDMSEVEADKEIAQRAAEDALREQGIRELMARDAATRLSMKQAEEGIEATEERLAGPKPPKRQPEWGETAGKAVPKRRRTSTEAIPSAQEQTLTGTPL